MRRARPLPSSPPLSTLLPRDSNQLILLCINYRGKEAVPALRRSAGEVLDNRRPRAFSTMNPVRPSPFPFCSLFFPFDEILTRLLFYDNLICG